MEVIGEKEKNLLAASHHPGFCLCHGGVSDFLDRDDISQTRSVRFY